VVHRFWEAIETLKNLPLSQVPDEVISIWAEYLAPDAKCSVNIDCRSLELTKEALNPPSRWSFDVAAVSIAVVVLSIYRGIDRNFYWEWFLCQN
jgi:hypothetical protein